jgi:RNA exonuclease 1
MSKRKRSQDDYDTLSSNSVGQTLARLNGASPQPDAIPKPIDGTTTTTTTEEPKDPSNDNGDDWEVAGSKRSKKRNYPEISYAAHARLQSYVKIYDLQNLVLYLLADGTAPQWCSIKHHSGVRKVVTLMVPGLEAGLFNGGIDLEAGEEKVEEVVKEERMEEQKENGENGSSENNGVLLGAQLFGGAPATANGVEVEVKAHTLPEEAIVALKPKPANGRKLKITPDDYYPTKLDEERVPEPLLPIGQTFDHLWPIKTAGDDRNSKMHSPLAAMLTSTIPRTKEEKNHKGPKPPAEGKNWKNKRTPVTEMEGLKRRTDERTRRLRKTVGLIQRAWKSCLMETHRLIRSKKALSHKAGKFWLWIARCASLPQKV